MIQLEPIAEGLAPLQSRHDRARHNQLTLVLWSKKDTNPYPGRYLIIGKDRNPSNVVCLEVVRPRRDNHGKTVFGSDKGQQSRFCPPYTLTNTRIAAPDQRPTRCSESHDPL
jgi:hypothetical protein